MSDVSIGKNGFSNRHIISLNGYRILEAVSNLAEAPAIAVGAENITKRHIREFLGNNNFGIDQACLDGELVALTTIYYLKYDGSSKGYTLTDRGAYQINANLQRHPTIVASGITPRKTR